MTPFSDASRWLISHAPAWEMHAQAWEISQRDASHTGVITPPHNPPGGLRRGVITPVCDTLLSVISHAWACIPISKCMLRDEELPSMHPATAPPGVTPIHPSVAPLW